MEGVVGFAIVIVHDSARHAIIEGLVLPIRERAHALVFVFDRLLLGTFAVLSPLVSAFFQPQGLVVAQALDG